MCIAQDGEIIFIGAIVIEKTVVGRRVFVAENRFYYHKEQF